MRISDWSSDVCSSDLRRIVHGRDVERDPRCSGETGRILNLVNERNLSGEIGIRGNLQLAVAQIGHRHTGRIEAPADDDGLMVRVAVTVDPLARSDPQRPTLPPTSHPRRAGTARPTPRTPPRPPSPPPPPPH